MYLSLNLQKNNTELKDLVKESRSEEKHMLVVDQCPECVKRGDYSPKQLFPCAICKTLRCSDHLDSRLAYIIDLSGSDEIAKGTRAIIDLDRAKKGGHPCFPYSVKYWNNYVSDKWLEDERLKFALDSLNYSPSRGNIKFSNPKNEVDEIRKLEEAEIVVHPKEKLEEKTERKTEEKHISLWQRFKRAFL